jgi:hypothetical protein
VHQVAGGEPTAQIEARTVREAMFKTSALFPSLRLVNCEGAVRSIIKVYLNGQPADLDDSLTDGDELLLATQ